MTGSIGNDELHAAEQRRQQGLLAGVGGSAVAALAFVGALAGLPAAVAAVLITGALLAAAFGFAAFVHHGQVIAIGSTSSWRRAQVTVVGVGVGKQHRVRVQLADCRWAHEPWGASSNSSTLKGSEQLDVAGDPGGRILLRIPGDHKVRIFKPVY